jgi:hypothetical protein
MDMLSGTALPSEHRGDHAPIVDRDLFDTVQARLAAQAVARRCWLRGLPASA